MINDDEEKERLFRLLKEKMSPEDFDKMQKIFKNLKNMKK